MIVNWILFYVIISVLQATLISAQTDRCHCANGTAGDCSCYCHLENSLFSSDGNRENLTRAFFPIESSPAEFIVITYKINMKESLQVKCGIGVHDHHISGSLTKYFGSHRSCLLSSTSCKLWN